MNTQKGIIKLLLIFIIIVLLGIIGFLIRERKTQSMDVYVQTGDKDTVGTSTPVSPVTSPKSGINGKVTQKTCVGMVTNQSSEPPCTVSAIANAAIVITNDSSGAIKNVTTDSRGMFHVELNPGKYTVSRQGDKVVGTKSVSVTVVSGSFASAELEIILAAQ